MWCEPFPPAPPAVIVLVVFFKACYFNHYWLLNLNAYRSSNILKRIGFFLRATSTSSFSCIIFIFDSSSTSSSICRVSAGASLPGFFGYLPGRFPVFLVAAGVVALLSEVISELLLFSNDSSSPQPFKLPSSCSSSS